MSLLVPVWFAAGLAWWTLLEYLLHRFAFHSGAGGLGRRHAAHHADVRSRDLALASPPAVALGLGLHTLAFVGFLGALPGGAALLGLAAGYAAYEAVHLAVHRPGPKSRWLRRLRRHHLLHHGAEPYARFGVTSSFWDRVFGTRGSSDTRRSRRAGPAHVPTPELRAPGLTRRQARVALAVAEALFSDASGPPPRERLEQAVREVGRFAQRVGTQTRFGVRVALLLLQASPLLFFGKLRRFTAASLALRIACFERLEGGPLGILAVALKLPLCLAYFEQPEALAETGYDGPGLPRALPILAPPPVEEQA